MVTASAVHVLCSSVHSKEVPLWKEALEHHNTYSEFPPIWNSTFVML
jgi:hypothetical protein